MASQPSSRRAFADSSINISRSYNFHGLDINWEFPATATDVSNFGVLLAEWRASVANESQTSGRPPLLLVTAVYYSATYHSLMHPIQSISDNLDWIDVMAYNFFAPGWSPNVTGPPASLYNPISPIKVEILGSAWLQAGVPASKIAFGLPFYGCAWNLTDPDQHGIFAPNNGMAIPPDSALGYARSGLVQL